MQQNPNPNVNGSPANFSNPIRGSHHRRARSELPFRIPDDFTDPITPPSNNFDEIGSEDDLFSTFMDIEKFGCRLEGSGCGFDSQDPIARKPMPHRHSNSVDGSPMTSTAALMEVKKAMSAEKLAELAEIDPKRAKRILANRQSAARSKERKTHHISELEQKVQSLQTETTTLSTQLTLYQRDTARLNSDNAVLKIRLQAMEQQAQLCDALNEAMRQEVLRLKIATGEIANPNLSLNYGNPSFFGIPQNQQPKQYHGILQMQQSNALSDFMQQDPLGRSLEGLDISKGSSTAVKSENSSAPPASGSSSSK